MLVILLGKRFSVKVLIFSAEQAENFVTSLIVYNIQTVLINSCNFDEKRGGNNK